MLDPLRSRKMVPNYTWISSFSNDIYQYTKDKVFSAREAFLSKKDIIFTKNIKSFVILVKLGSKELLCDTNKYLSIIAYMYITSSTYHLFLPW